MTLNRFSGVLLVAAVSLAPVAAEAAIDTGACCVQRTSYLDSLINPTKGSDEEFFSSGGGKPNVLFIIDTSCSMNAWPENWPTTEGCDHPDFAGAGFEPGADYKGIIKSIDGGVLIENPNWYPDTRVYAAAGSTSYMSPPAIGNNLAGSPGGVQWNNRDDACNDTSLVPNLTLACSASRQNPVSGTTCNPGYTYNSGFSGTQKCCPNAAYTAPGPDTTKRERCKACIRDHGYYVKDNDERAASGKFLKFYSPRDVSAMMVLSQLAAEVRDVRLSIMTFHPPQGITSSERCWDNNYACMWKKPDDACAVTTEASVIAERNGILRDLQTSGTMFTWGNNTPLANSLWAANYFLRGTSPSDAFSNMFGMHPTPANTSATNWFRNANSTASKPICNGCSFNAIVILTDGDPNETEYGFPAKVSARYSADGGTSSTCPANTGVCNSSLDEIASYFWEQPDWNDTSAANREKDLRPDYLLKQRVATYTIGFATGNDANKLLNSTAVAGHGSYYPAKSAATIVNVLNQILDDIVSRNNSFASASVASVQTGASSTPAVLARVLPRAGETWKGRLWRFNQFNEFVENRDLNGDGDLADIFTVDSAPDLPDGGRGETAANIIVEDSSGEFIRQSTGNPAQPYWEANGVLSDGGTTGASVTAALVSTSRNVWTLLDIDNDGAFTDADADGGMVQFKFTGAGEVNAAGTELKLASYMGLRGSPYCPSSSNRGSLIDRIGVSDADIISLTKLTGLSSTTITNLTGDERARICVRLMMLWANGYDLLDSNKDGLRNQLRPDVLGDVFHSSPINVEPPIEPFLCDLGLSTQCARTIYAAALSGEVPTRQSAAAAVTPAGASVCSASRSLAPYQAWQAKYSARQKVILVGANDGMVHAFDNGNYVDTKSQCPGGVLLPSYDNGTGKEIWAFIPPDQLPRLPSQVFEHQYMIDGDVMVRDVWNDDNNNGIKDHNEFHTLAVVAEGRGGNHYIALELLFDDSSGAPRLASKPGFRWMYPQPCSEEAATFGKTLLSLSPKAPPIGPVWMSPDSARGLVKDDVSGRDRVERWVVGVPGGWSPGLERGRGVYLLDAYRGKLPGRRDNLWWKFEFKENAAIHKEAKFSVTAPLALVDYGGNGQQPVQDGFFDTAIWGDTGGQVWVARMDTPATFDNSTHLINNWPVARTFEMDRDGVVPPATASLEPDGGVEALATDAKLFANKQPFYYLPSVAIEPGSNRMRVFMGTGNRYALLENKAGMCRFDNLGACSKYGCSDPRARYRFRDGVVSINKMEMNWKAKRFEKAKLEETISVPGTTVSLNNSDACNTDVTAEMQIFHTGACWGTPNRDINESSYTCKKTTVDGADSFTCSAATPPDREGHLDDLFPYEDLDATGIGNNRFIGFWAYGGAQTDGGLRTFGGDGGLASDFDQRRITDRSASVTGFGELTDVTKVNCTPLGCDGGAPQNGFGWVIDYNNIERKTATGGAVIASCVLWSDLAPTGGDGGTCGAAVVPASSLYQADFITGQPNCAAGFLSADGGVYVRSVQRAIVAPPPEPASVVQVSKTGQIKYSAMIVEPGQNQATTVDVSAGQDILQVVYELPISRAMHNCRHTQDGNCVVAP